MVHVCGQDPAPPAAAVQPDTRSCRHHTPVTARQPTSSSSSAWVPAGNSKVWTHLKLAAAEETAALMLRAGRVTGCLQCPGPLQCSKLKHYAHGASCCHACSWCPAGVTCP